MRLTLPHYYDFGPDRDLLGGDRLGPLDWDSLRVDGRGIFRFPADPEEYERLVEESEWQERRARALAGWLAESRARTVASYGVGPGIAETWLRRLVPEIRLVLTDIAPRTVDLLRFHFDADDVHLHDFCREQPLEADLHLFNGVDTELNDEAWRDVLRRFSDRRVLLFPNITLGTRTWSERSGAAGREAADAGGVVADEGSLRRADGADAPRAAAGRRSGGARLDARAAKMTQDALAGRRAVVTGGMGFIGSHLAHALVDRGAEVTIVDSLIPEYGGNPFNVREIADRVDIQYTDIRDPWAIRRLVRDKDLIFNLAGQVSHIDSMTDPETDLEINGRAQLSLLEALRADNPEAKVVFAASRQQYGRPRELPVTEDHPMEPVDVNGINLVAAERFHLLYTDVYAIRTVSLRLTNTYGPHLLMKHDRQGSSPPSSAAPSTARRSGLRRRRAARDFTYVDDAVDAFLAAAVTESADGQALNVGGIEPVSLIEVAELCQRIAGAGGGVSYPLAGGARRIDIGSVYLDRSRIREVCGWEPRVGLADGLERTFDFYRRFRDHYWT